MDQNTIIGQDDSIIAVVQELHAAIEQKDGQHLGELVIPEVFVIGAAAEAVSIGRDQFVTYLRSQFEEGKETELHVQPAQLQVGLCASGRSAWLLDRFDLEVVGALKIPHQIPIRLTGLLVRDQDWQLAAAYWSIPLRDNDYQYTLLQ